MSEELEKAYKEHIEALRNLNDILEKIIEDQNATIIKLQDELIIMQSRAIEVNNVSS